MFELIQGHKAALERLETLHESGRISPVYLFVGPPGVGKRQIALEWFRSSMFPKGTNMNDKQPLEDLKVVARAHESREIGIADIRDAIAFLYLKPMRSPIRTLLVDGADAMTEPAMNAFLKTLEEPPRYARIILIASSIAPILPTILSRCHIVRFGPLPDDTVSEIVIKTMNASPAWVASLAGGSPGEALHLAANSDAINRLIEGLQQGLSPGQLEGSLKTLRSVHLQDSDEPTESENETSDSSSSDSTRLAIRVLLSGLRSRWRAGLTGQIPQVTETLQFPLPTESPDLLQNKLERLLALEVALSQYANPNTILADALLTAGGPSL